MTLLSILVLGFFLGMRHATDADHVVAVTTIVSRQNSLRASLGIGALWGLGHTVTILLVGGLIITLGLVVPPRLGLSMEFSVAVMLVVLGVLNLTGIARRFDEVAHAHGAEPAHRAADRAHEHRAATRHEHPAGRFGPLLVGVVHGLAGSAAVALLVLATIRDAGSAMLYLGVFGLGTILGMMILTSAMAVPVRLASARFVGARRHLARIAGVVSIAFGLFLAYQIGFVDGLFLQHAEWSPH